MRRMFWLSIGAVAGVTGYRRVTALARALRPERQEIGRGGGVGASTSLAGFAADVREGMALYLDRQARRAPHTLERRIKRGLARGTPPHRAPSRNELKDGR